MSKTLIGIAAASIVAALSISAANAAPQSQTNSSQEGSLNQSFNKKSMLLEVKEAWLENEVNGNNRVREYSPSSKSVALQQKYKYQ